MDVWEVKGGRRLQAIDDKAGRAFFFADGERVAFFQSSEIWVRSVKSKKELCRMQVEAFGIAAALDSKKELAVIAGIGHRHE